MALEAVSVGANGKKSKFEVVRMASEKVIVRASNPGQFETDNEPPWTKDPGNDTVYHIGTKMIGPSMFMECNPTLDLDLFQDALV